MVSPPATSPDVLLVHGFGTSFESTWRHNGWVDLLSDAGRRVVGVDLLGHGAAPKPTEPEAYRDLEDRVLDEMPDDPVDAVGFSAGAMALWWLAAHHPHRFRRIVVSGVGQNLFPPDPNEGKDGGDADEAGRGAADDRALRIAEAVRTGVADDPELRYFADLPEAGSPQPGSRDREALAAFMTRPDRRRFTAEILARVTAPVLVVLGDRDFAGPADSLVDALPDAIFRELRGVDHFATPKHFGFLEAALDFLDAQAF
ncbi:MAG: alpha/beta fold hydrolase [Actinomycetota bacterium]|nr:alpha/beta fold hydrolase [Actinomycetota bacterium]